MNSKTLKSQLHYLFTRLQVYKLFIGLAPGVQHRSVLCVYANQTLVLPDVFCNPEIRPESSSGCDPACPTIRNKNRKPKATGKRRKLSNQPDGNRMSDLDGSGSGDFETGSGSGDEEADVSSTVTDAGHAEAELEQQEGKISLVLSLSIEIIDAC